MIRTGIGYDTHRLAPGRPLVLGGVEIESELGLEGHSDADALTHAVMDALLGAAALGDIGQHFPDTDERFKEADSIGLLTEVGLLLGSHGYEINNIDATVSLERPKIGDYRQQMCERIAAALELDPGRVSVKATTGEGIGFIGRAEGAAALAIATIESS